ncbi:hypothetical protein M011DRAFT_492809 [Sporormia fimetaria CBS 119925]|uniref:Formin GTPase-binding domain-containing protein n=1 Tax=Sporormia fimetaria CBS 119925 TaxID=1340428 RepID=A0A6A6VGM7_9PLEO|nr:hypothetical protein M011DRAFT_492809 [Sporormia fimetaria CBS 119925]
MSRTDVTASPVKTLHKKTKSSLSLRSLGRSKEKELPDPAPEMEKEKALSPKPKKTKSSRNLAAMFSNSKMKEAKAIFVKDKENTTPPGSALGPAPAHTPIWAEFSTQPPLRVITTTSKLPLNDRHNVEDEIALYTPREYSPSKQRNFAGYGIPSLQKRGSGKERPKSTFLPNTNTAALLDSFTRKRSDERVPLSDAHGNGEHAGPSSRGFSARDLLKRANSDGVQKKEELRQPASPVKRQSRVMAAVAAFNGRAKEAQSTPPSPTKMDPQAVEVEFESVLESRNIPQHQRAAMRTLKLEVKADFVRTHKLETPTVSRAASGQSAPGDEGSRKSAKSTLSRGRKSRYAAEDDGKIPDEAGASKRERPRSKTFTFSKGDSPVKKQKPEDERKSSRSSAIPKTPSLRSLRSNASSKSNKGAKASLPDDFVAYMKVMQKVQDVEVGRLHKLRQLLRNETVEWVDAFVQDGGMRELVGLLHRIMEVEWREDHEDQLLHEVLRCLKGLCTTDSALKQLAELSSTLFPALLAMLFDEEHKGPSEFTTRELIVQIIFAHLSTAPEAELHTRAQELLNYLKDPVREKETSTVPFILQMHQPRPYQVWCKEINNVTKEVFWIFIHHLNVVPLPKPSDGSPRPYFKTHFPGPRAIVPAAPYVGGVEWDATNYIATHLDLLNGIIACLPTRRERNVLRADFKVSGFEKLMGHLRACNPKYYGAVHDSVKVWIGAALEDGWDVNVVRKGSEDGKPPSPMKTSPKKKVEDAPKLEAPKMDLGLGLGLGLDGRFDKSPGVKKDDFWL